jgi:hypothetical protein
MGFILFWAAYVLHLAIRVLTFWYKPIYFFSRYGFKQGLFEWNRHNLHQAMAEDQSANVSLYPMMNKLFTKGKASWHYGDEDDTISYCSAMAYRKDPDNSPAKGLVKFLRFVDKDHDIKAINGKILRDLEAAERLAKAGIITKINVLEISSDKDDDSWRLYVRAIENKKREINL